MQPVGGRAESALVQDGRQGAQILAVHEGILIAMKNISLYFTNGLS